MPDFDHIFLSGNVTSFPYSTYGRRDFPIRLIQGRRQHGEKIRNSFNDAVTEFTEGDEEYEFVYIEFESAINFELAFDSFEDSTGNIRLASCKTISTFTEGEDEQTTYKVAVYLNRSAVSNFLNKVEKYLEEDTPAGNPKYQRLVANIEDIRAATLESFWQEPEVGFPSSNDNVWWEVWFSKSDRAAILESFPSLRENGILVNERLLEFPENTVCLIKGTPNQLGRTILYQDNLAELRKPVETSDFFASLDRTWSQEFIDDLRTRVTNQIEQHGISVCLLDTGVNRINPLLEDLIPARNLDSINPSWTTSDSYRYGHGTQMAGLILYGDLNEPLSSSNSILVSNRVESIKIFNASSPNDPDLYGQITLEAIASAEVINPDNKRVVCLAVTAQEYNHFGRPSSWSAAIDQRLFGTVEERNDNTLILISGGNIPIHERINYPLVNDDSSIEDPAQSFNAITVGSYTNKDRLDNTLFPGATLLAGRGGMSPCNTTSILWDNNWPRKPDIVFEGGNDGIFQDSVFDHESLKLLSTGVGGVGKSWLATFSDTSASVALAAKFASELYQQYPDLRPETIRALMIHSAEWTSTMLNGNNIGDLNSVQKAAILSKVGYGIPNLAKAKYSAENSLNIIAERTLTPFKYEDSRVKTNEFHLFDIPWPSDILVELAEQEVRLKVTLSYFIEPNPGNRRYANDQSYKSFGLRFKMIDRNEGLESFKARVSKAIRDEQDDYVQEGSENWILGSQVRDKGSIHKDIWIGNAADLALRNKIAIYPVGGWWKMRKRLNRYLSSVRYSLIVSIETDTIDVDLYNDVLAKISVPISID